MDGGGVVELDRFEVLEEAYQMLHLHALQDLVLRVCDGLGALQLILRLGDPALLRENRPRQNHRLRKVRSWKVRTRIFDSLPNSSSMGMYAVWISQRQGRGEKACGYLLSPVVSAPLDGSL